MNLFSIHLWDWEGNMEWLFQHPTKTEADFDSDVKKLLQIHAEDYFESEGEGYRNTHDWITFILPELHKLGYEQPKIYSLVADNEGIIGDRKGNFKNWVGEELYNKAYKHNKKYNKWI